MPMKYSDAVRNAKLDAVEAAIGASPVLRIRTLAPPASVGAADVGIVLAEIPLPADWMGAASGGVKAMLGTWADNAADNTGTAAHFRIYAGGVGGIAHIQGTVSATGGGGDMQVDNVSFAAGQPFSVTQFSIADNNG